MIPAQTLEFLRAPSLSAMWSTIHTRLERNGLNASGSIRVDFDVDGAERYRGLTNRKTEPGIVTVKLEALDLALRLSAASASLLEVTEAVTGRPLVDKRKARVDRRNETSELMALLEQACMSTLTSEQTHRFVGGVRKSGLFTAAGSDAATRAIKGFAAGWRKLSSQTLIADAITEPVFELAELAANATTSAHGFDEGTLAGNLMLRALAVTFDTSNPITAEQRRQLWEAGGVAVDDVSGTALTFGFRPPGKDPWSTMMRERADLGVVSHLTIQELRAATSEVSLTDASATVFAFENPQVLQAAVRAGVDVPMLALSGQGSAASWKVLRKLLRDGIKVQYHGDFDWAGVGIVGRVWRAGAAPWRMTAAHYLTAAAGSADRIGLEGRPVDTPWDPPLAEAMRRSGVSVHEEELIGSLLGDLSSGG